jgi:hypothetical protein
MNCQQIRMFASHNSNIAEAYIKKQFFNLRAFDMFRSLLILNP